MKKSLITCYLLLVTAWLAAPMGAAAALQLVPACAREGRLCQLNDMVQTAIVFGRILLGFVGTAVLFFFIYGGFVWLTSGGATEKIKKGKDIVINSVIGLIIVFGAFTLVQFINQAFQVKQEFQLGGECCANSSTPPCGENNPRGVNLLLPDGSQSCELACEGKLSNLGYTCRAPEAGSNCIDIYGCAEGQFCCQPK